MAVFFLLVAVLAGAAIGDAIYENTGAGTVVIAQQTTDRLTQGELLAIFAGLGFLLAFLLLLAVAAAPRRRARRRERRARASSPPGRPVPADRGRAAAADPGRTVPADATTAVLPGRTRTD